MRRVVLQTSLSLSHPLDDGRAGSVGHHTSPQGEMAHMLTTTPISSHVLPDASEDERPFTLRERRHCHDCVGRFIPKTILTLPILAWTSPRTSP